MSRLKRLAIDTSITNSNKTYITAEQMINLIQYIKKQAENIASSNKSFISTLGDINRIIMFLNKKYKLSPEIRTFSPRELAEITYEGFEIIYNNIQHQNMDNLAQNLNVLKDININSDFNQLNINKRAEICQNIINNIGSAQLRDTVFEMIGPALYNRLHKSIGNLSNDFSFDIFYAFNTRVVQPLHESFLRTWIQLNMSNIDRKINNIIHNTVPIIYDNYDDYDDNMDINENGTDPNTWIEYTDKEDPKHGVRESNVAPMYFSSIRISPLVVLDNEVLYSQDAKKHHNDLINEYKERMNLKDTNESLAYTEGVKSILEEFGASNMAIGSLFNGTVALLEYVTDGKEEEIVDENNLIRPNNGNPDIIIRSLQNKGIKKVYIQHVSPWVSREYERIASKRNRLMKKILG